MKTTLVRIRLSCMDNELLHRMGVSSQCIEALAVYLVSKDLQDNPTQFFHNHTNSIKLKLHIDNKRFEPIKKLKCFVKTLFQCVQEGILMMKSDYVPDKCYTCARYNISNSINPDGTKNLAFICTMTGTFEHPDNGCIDYALHERYKVTLQKCK